MHIKLAFLLVHFRTHSYTPFKKVSIHVDEKLRHQNGISGTRVHIFWWTWQDTSVSIKYRGISTHVLCGDTVDTHGYMCIHLLVHIYPHLCIQYVWVYVYRHGSMCTYYISMVYTMCPHVYRVCIHMWFRLHQKWIHLSVQGPKTELYQVC